MSLGMKIAGTALPSDTPYAVLFAISLPTFMVTSQLPQKAIFPV